MNSALFPRLQRERHGCCVRQDLAPDRFGGKAIPKLRARRQTPATPDHACTGTVPGVVLISPMNPAKMGPGKAASRAPGAGHSRAVRGRGLRVDMPHKAGLESGSAIVLFGDAIGSSGHIGRRCGLAARERRIRAGTVEKGRCRMGRRGVREIRSAWRSGRPAGSSPVWLARHAWQQTWERS